MWITKNAKRQFAILCILVSFILIPPFGEAEQASNFDFPSPTVFLAEGGQALLTGYADTYWLEDESVVLGQRIETSGPSYTDPYFSYTWEIGTHSFQKMRELPEEMPRRTYHQKDGVCAYFEKTGEIAFYQYGKKTILGKIEPGDKIYLGDKRYGHSTKQILYDGKLVYFLSYEEDPRAHALTIYDTETNTYSTYEDLRIEQMVQYRAPTELLVYKEGSIYPLSTETMEWGAPLVTGLSYSAPFEYSCENETLYYVSEGDIYQKKNNQTSELIFVGDHYDDCGKDSENDDRYWYMRGWLEFSISSLLPLPGNKLMFASSGLYVIDANPLKSEIEDMHVMEMPYYSRDINHSHYKLTHPNVRRIFCTGDDNDPNHPLDLLNLSTSSTLSTMLGEKRLLDLSESRPIVEFYNSSMPQIQDAFGEDGIPYALPIDMKFHLWNYDSELLTNPPTTMAEFWEQYLQYGEMQNDNPVLNYYGIKMSLPFESVKYNLVLAVAVQYACETSAGGSPINFDTPEFQELVNTILQTDDMQQKDSDTYVTESQYVATSDLLIIQDNFPYAQPFMPPKLWVDSTPAVGATAIVFCIPKTAGNPDVALDYLSHYADIQNTYSPINLFLFTGGDESAVLRLINSSSLQQNEALRLPLETIEMDGFPQNLQPYWMVVQKPALDLYKEIAPFITFYADPFALYDLFYDVYDGDEVIMDNWDESTGSPDLIPMLNEVAKQFLQPNP